MPKSIKTAAMLSFILTDIFLLAVLYISLFQKQIILNTLNISADEYKTVFAFSTVTYIISSIIIGTICLMFWLDKVENGIAPLVVSSAVVVVYPLAVNILNYYQTKYAAAKGMIYIAELNMISVLETKASYLLFIGAVITVAITAVNCYIKYNSKMTEGKQL